VTPSGREPPPRGTLEVIAGSANRGTT